MEELYNRAKELKLMKKEIELAQRKYNNAFKKMLVDFVKALGLDEDRHCEVNDTVGILKVGPPDKESSDPYVIKFCPLKDNGVPSMNATYIWSLSTNDFDSIRAAVKYVEIEFYD